MAKNILRASYLTSKLQLLHLQIKILTTPLPKTVSAMCLALCLAYKELKKKSISQVIAEVSSVMTTMMVFTSSSDNSGG